jgi:hypothetical protein
MGCMACTEPQCLYKECTLPSFTYTVLQSFVLIALAWPLLIVPWMVRSASVLCIVLYLDFCQNLDLLNVIGSLTCGYRGNVEQALKYV